VAMDNPQPGGTTPYFVLRNNDPAIDGFFLSPGVDLDFPLSVRIPGLAPAHELSFKHTLANGTTLSSLNILDAAGSYNLSTNVSSYLFGIGRFGNLGAEYVPGQLTITVVPEPAALWLMGLGGGVLWWRARRQAT
jgi:PEP-CTERM motif